jgi:uncharacterized protein YbaR (Trm112 family)
MLAPDFLKILRCPDDRSALAEADAATLAALNRAVEQGRLRNRGGEIVERKLDGGLVRSDGAYLYPIFDGIPVLIVEEGIATASIQEDSKP